jgi:DNA-binding cell septation regulator SpoVG
MSEPKFGYKNVIKAKKEGKVKAFFNLLIPTETIGTIELSGFKIIEGTKGLFISLPNRAQKVAKEQTVATAAGPVAGTVEETKYFNNIRFESQEKYNEFRDILNKEVLPLITAQLS